MSLNVTQNEVLLCVYDLFAFRNLFRAGKDGLAVELVSFQNQYSCDEKVSSTPNTRNGFSLIDGQLLAPVYRNDLHKQVIELYEKARNRPKVKGERQCHYIKLGKTPDNMSDFPLEAKLHFINGKNLCSELNFYSYCGKLPEVRAEGLELILELPETQVLPQKKTTTVKAQVNYARGEVTFQEEDLAQVVAYLKNREIQIESIRLQAYASVEGSERENRSLFTQRAQKLVSYLQTFQPDSIPYRVESEENWKLFYDQIKEGPFSFLAPKKVDELRDWLKEPENREKVEPLLEEQRQATVVLSVRPIESDFWDWLLLRDEFLEAVAASSDPSDRLELVQRYLIKNQHQVGAEESLPFDTVVVSSAPGWENIWYTQMIYRMKKRGDVSPFKLTQQLRKLNATIQSKEADYNLKVLLSQNLELLKAPERIGLAQSLIKEGTGWPPDSVMAQLQLWFHLEMAQLVFLSQDEEDLSKAAPSLDYLVKEYLYADSSDQRKVELGSILLAFDRIEQADSVLRPLVFRDQPQREAMRLYLTVIAPQRFEDREPALAHLLLDSYEKMGRKSWCRLFIGRCKVPLYVLDQPGLRSTYCEVCSDLINSPAD